MRAKMTFCFWRVLTVCALMLLAGCGGAEMSGDATTADAPAGLTRQMDYAAAAGSAAPMAAAPMSAEMAKTKGVLVTTAPRPGDQKLQRKIIYNSTVDVVVESLNPAQQKLLDLVRKHGGYVAEANVGGSAGSPRTGTWKVRIPVSGYDGFMDAVKKIGELRSVNSKSDDVSAEFYDVEARLKNKRVEEARLIEHLKRSTAKLSDILAVEREISRVRGEIEQMQGRLRVLNDLTALTTITVTLNEIKNYVPPAPPTFATQIGRTFSGSLEAVGNFFKGAVLFVVGALPWLVVLIPMALVLRWLARRAKPRGPLFPDTDVNIKTVPPRTDETNEP